MISHHTRTRVPDGPSTAQLAAEVEGRLRQADKLVLPLEQTLDLLAQLQEFELGRFLLHNRGLNGYWTSYIFQYSPGDATSSPVEHWLLNNSLLRGGRERFHRFKAQVAECVTEAAVLASIPCGAMDDLVQQDYRSVERFTLVGVDVDAESIELARENAAKHGIVQHCEFLVRDAWQLDLDGELDLVVSNGLNMYESDPRRLAALYRNFSRALRPGGQLLLSFLPPPPPPPWEAPDRAGEWDRYGVTEEDLRNELSLFGDILQVRYLNFATEAEVRAQLAEAGLTVRSVTYSSTGVMPIVSAVRLS
ncbi:MAG: class I SAM-dependent methyltransferase [Pseudonocardiales bacterium]|nr:class I SAM-dependent methyltransferase [Pseudonocardiales bacterium]